MNQRSKYLIRNVGLLTVSNFASKILIFLLVPLYTSVLSTDEVGVYDLVVSTTSLLFPLLTLNIVDAVMRFLMDNDKSKEEIALIGLKYLSLSIIPVAAFLIIIERAGLLEQISGYEYYILAYFLASSANQFLIQFAKGVEKVASMGLAGVIGTVTMLLSNILFLLVFKAGLPGFFIANILGQALPAIYLFCSTRLWQYIRIKKVNRVLQREMLVYCAPLIATAVGWWINSAADKYVVTFFCGVAANGILSVSYKVPAIINTVQSIFIQAWQISAIKEYGEKDTAEFYGKTFSILNLLMSAVCSWLIILSKPIGYVLYQKEFYIAWQYVPFLLISSVLNSSSGFLGPILSAKKASKPMALSAVYGAVANIFLNFLLVYLIGIQGATIATAVSSLIIYLVRKRAVGKEIIIPRYGVVFVTWALLAVQAVFEIYTVFWWAEALLMMVMVIINRDGMIDVIKLIKSVIHRRREK